MVMAAATPPRRRRVRFLAPAALVIGVTAVALVITSAPNIIPTHSSHDNKPP